MQIHHIDEDHSNSTDPANLAVLCLLCHDETMQSGGFGRGLNAAQVRIYRDEWNVAVQRRRDTADRLAAETMANIPASPETTVIEVQTEETVRIAEGVAIALGESRATARSQIPIPDYVRTLPGLLRRAKNVAQPEWDSGITGRMVNATYGVIDVLERMLTTLASYYPSGHFDTERPEEYFSELISTRYQWHRYHLEPDGKGQNGTMANVRVGGAVLSDVKKMVDEMVVSLAAEWDGLNDWRVEWQSI